MITVSYRPSLLQRINILPQSLYSQRRYSATLPVSHPTFSLIMHVDRIHVGEQKTLLLRWHVLTDYRANRGVWYQRALFWDVSEFLVSVTTCELKHSCRFVMAAFSVSCKPVIIVRPVLNANYKWFISGPTFGMFDTSGREVDLTCGPAQVGSSFVSDAKVSFLQYQLLLSVLECVTHRCTYSFQPHCCGLSTHLLSAK